MNLQRKSPEPKNTNSHWGIGAIQGTKSHHQDSRPKTMKRSRSHKSSSDMVDFDEYFMNQLHVSVHAVGTSAE